jgi:AraC-like DNA-binding protein
VNDGAPAFRRRTGSCGNAAIGSGAGQEHWAAGGQDGAASVEPPAERSIVALCQGRATHLVRKRVRRFPRRRSSADEIIRAMAQKSIRRASQGLAGVPRSHAILVQALAGVFIELRLSASFLDLDVALPNGEWIWYPIHRVADVTDFEQGYAVEKQREAHNVRSVDRARREGKLVLVEHAGLHDLYVPMAHGEKTWGVLIAGPFSIGRPTSGDLLARWRWLTGRYGSASDPEFARYLTMTLATTTFEHAELDAFERLLQCYAQRFAGRGDQERLSSEVEALGKKLVGVRYADRMWDAVRGMVDASTWRAWQSQQKARELRDMGADKPPEYIAVGLLIGRRDKDDPVEDMLGRDAFQRACVDLVRKTRGILCGRVGDHGVAFLSAGGERGRLRLGEMAERAAVLARRHALKLHVGLCDGGASIPLPVRFQAALSAAEKALAEGRPVVRAERAAAHGGASPLGELRLRLSELLGERPSLLAPTFDRYVEAVGTHCGYRFEPARAHLEAGFDAIVHALRAAAAVDERSLDELQQSLHRAASEASTLDELSAAYRTVVSDVVLAMSRPHEAGRQRSVRRAIAFIRDHVGEPLTLAKVARVAGFAPNYFCKVFAQSEKTTFQTYVRQRRIERAKHMLVTTTFSAEQIARLCGFGSRTHFHRAFRQSLGLSPLGYRTRAGMLHERERRR